MAEIPCERYATELAATFRRLSRLRHRLRVVLPENLSRLEAQLDASYPLGRAESADDFDLLHRVGAILAQQREPVTMGDLGRALDVPLSTATRIVDWLVSNDYVQRQADLEDRRVVRVTLTAAGAEVYRAITAFVRERAERFLRRFTAEERACLVTLVRKLVDAPEEEA